MAVCGDWHVIVFGRHYNFTTHIKFQHMIIAYNNKCYIHTVWFKPNLINMQWSHV